MPRINRIGRWAVGTAICMVMCPAQAQSNLDAGKTPAQIFAGTCNACHRSARDLRPTNARFLLQHYTTGSQEAVAMAAYLAAVGSDPRAVQQRRQPATGAGQAATTSTRRPPPADQAGLPAATPGRPAPATSEHSPPGTAPAAALKPRRPSESVEAGALPVDAVQGRDVEAATPQAAAAAAPARPTPAQAFEE